MKLVKAGMAGKLQRDGILDGHEGWSRLGFSLHFTSSLP